MHDRSQLITRDELAARLGVISRTIDRWCRDGVRGVRLPMQRIGARVMFLPRDVEQWQRDVDKAISRRTNVTTRREDAAEHKRARATLERLGLI